MLLKLTRQLDVIEVVETVNGISESLVVFLLDKQIVVRVIDGLNVELAMEQVGHHAMYPVKRHSHVGQQSGTSE